MIILVVTIACLAPLLVGGIAIHLGRRYRESDWGHGWLNVLDGLNRLFCRRYHRLNRIALPLPERGGAIVVANHLSGLDPLLLIASCARPLRFLIAREEYERFGLRWLFRAVGCIPVDRSARADGALRAALRALRDGEVIAMFPQGGIHTAETPALLKAGVARLAGRSGCLVYPAHIDGVRAPGHVLRPVVLRARARVRAFAPLACADGEQRACLDRLTRLLHKSLWGDPTHRDIHAP